MDVKKENNFYSNLENSIKKLESTIIDHIASRVPIERYKKIDMKNRAGIRGPLYDIGGTEYQVLPMEGVEELFEDLVRGFQNNMARALLAITTLRKLESHKNYALTITFNADKHREIISVMDLNIDLVEE